MSVISFYKADSPEAEKLKDDANRLAKLKGVSFSQLIWETLKKQVEENRESIDKMLELEDSTK